MAAASRRSAPRREGGDGWNPTNYDRISLAELPNSDEQLMAFRVNTARARVNMVGLPSVAAAALLADGLQRLRELLPQHSFAFFLSAHNVELDNLPSVLRERYAVLTWADSHAPAYVVAAQPAAPEQTVLRMIEASHLRTGGVLSLGVSPGQRLGLERVPIPDAAFAAMHAEAAAAAQRIAACEGAVRDVKRVRLSDFNRGAGVAMHNHAHKTTGFE